ncbi:MAG TPA: hypothetical protein VF152_06270 [Acidimicrobiia bacterium]
MRIRVALVLSAVALAPLALVAITTGRPASAGPGDPGDVLANLDSPSWHLSNSAGGLGDIPPTARPEAPPHWARVATEPAWGWFDHRLHPEAIAVPPDVLDRDEPATLARWSVPFEYGAERVTAIGRVEHQPAAGRVSARLVTPAAPLPGMVVQVAPGPVPGLLLRNTGTEPVTVFGPAGEPFARVGPAGAEVNRHSPLWADNARAQERDPATSTGVVDASIPADWVVISAAPTFAWLEFRGAADPDPRRAAGRAGEPTVLREWSVPLAANGRQAEVRGETIWAPGRAARAAPGGDSAGLVEARVAAAAGAAVAAVGAAAAAITWTRRRLGAVHRQTP